MAGASGRSIYPAHRIVVIFVSLLVPAGMQLVVRRTGFGLDMRTAIQNRGIAEAVGIKRRRTVGGAIDSFGGALQRLTALDRSRDLAFALGENTGAEACCSATPGGLAEGVSVAGLRSLQWRATAERRMAVHRLLQGHAVEGIAQIGESDAEWRNPPVVRQAFRADSMPHPASKWRGP